MKRPQGFDGPVARASRPPVLRSDASASASAGAEPVRGARAQNGPEPRMVRGAVATRTSGVAPGASRFDPDRIATEPIEVVATAPEPAIAADPSRVPVAGSTPGSSPVIPNGRTAPGAPTAGDARAAKRAVAAAARERRRYERQEVRRFTRRSRRRRIAWSVVLGSVVALVLVVGVGAYSPLMALREVRVEGASRIPAAEVEAAFAETMGTPLPLIASADVLAALSNFPLIETYSTETIPPGTLVVRIVERVPVGVVDTGEGLELVDAAGVVIERPDERPEGQPLIDVAEGLAGEGFRAASAVIRSLPPEVRGQLVKATAATADDVRLELATGATVVWGSAEESAQKAFVLATLMRAAPPDTVGEYDVSSPASVVTR